MPGRETLVMISHLEASILVQKRISGLSIGGGCEKRKSPDLDSEKESPGFVGC